MNSSLRHSTTKQYQYCWRKWVHCCREREINTYNPSEVNVLKYLGHLMKEKCSYSVINSNKAMLMQNLSLFRMDWINNQFLIPKLLKGYYNMNPPRPKCKIIWGVSKVLHF